MPARAARALVILIVVFAIYFVWQLIGHSGNPAHALSIVGSSVPVTSSSAARSQDLRSGPATSGTDLPSSHERTPYTVVVQVVGAVRKAGVYHFSVDQRGEDAVRAAGGLTPDANPDAVNLAAKLVDGTQLYIPTRKAHPEPLAATDPAAAVDSHVAPTPAVSREAFSTGAKSKRSGQSASAGQAAHRTGSHAGSKFSHPGTQSVNINTASGEQLQQLPGVGPAMAARIIDYRTTVGRFPSADQLMQVSGIGERKYAKMQPYVRVK